jgi:tetratricopeptide (TPR) repeat protein
MSEHVEPEDLPKLLSGTLERKKVCDAVAHLLHDCQPCREAVLPFALDLLSCPVLPAEETETETGLPPELDAAYDAAILRAFRGARRELRRLHARDRQRSNVGEMVARLNLEGIEGFLAAPRHLRGLSSVVALLQRSFELRQDDPKQMLQFAVLAFIEAGNLDRRELGKAQVEDTLCRAALELGNAYRVADRLAEAEEVLAEAERHFRKGTGDRRLEARLLNVRASLYGDQRRFELCFAAVDAVIALYRKLGERHLTGRALITKAVHTGYTDAPERAIELLQEGMALIDPARDPQLAVAAAHNIAWLMVDCRRYAEARRVLWESQRHTGPRTGQVERLKARWLEGRVNAGLGHLDLAERDLRAAQEGLAAAGLPYTAAIAALDLAEVELRRNRPEQAQALALQAVGAFVSLKISREAQTAVLFLDRIAKRRVMTEALLRDVADFLRQEEAEPKDRPEPGG